MCLIGFWICFCYSFMFLLFCYDSALVENWFIWPTQKINFYHKKFLYLPEVNQIFKRKNSSHTFERTDKQKKFYQKFFLILSRKSIFLNEKIFYALLKEALTWPTDLPQTPKRNLHPKKFLYFPRKSFKLVRKNHIF